MESSLAEFGAFVEEKYREEGERRFGGKDWKAWEEQKIYLHRFALPVFICKEGSLDRPSVGPLLIRVLLEKLLCG